jgi:citronellol/citronellal dehydrogenase
MAPPISLDGRWYRGHLAYSIAKFGMSMCVIGLAAEFADDGIAVNALWPQGPVNTAALRMTAGRFNPDDCPGPEMMADAAHAVLTRPSRERSGQFLIDDQVLRDEGVTDFGRYGGDPARWLTSGILPRKASL